jgi:hypothetical protein
MTKYHVYYPKSDEERPHQSVRGAQPVATLPVTLTLDLRILIIIVALLAIAVYFGVRWNQTARVSEPTRKSSSSSATSSADASELDESEFVRIDDDSDHLQGWNTVDAFQQT